MVKIDRVNIIIVAYVIYVIGKQFAMLYFQAEIQVFFEIKLKAKTQE